LTRRKTPISRENKNFFSWKQQYPEKRIVDVLSQGEPSTLGMMRKRYREHGNHDIPDFLLVFNAG
jgi:hypothetical protein